MKKVFLFSFLFVFFIVVTITLISYNLVRKRGNELEDGRVVKNGRLPGYSESIKSKNIVKFEYIGSEFYMFCELKNNKLHIISKDDNFKLDYEVKDLSFLNKLQAIIENNNISKNNGFEYEVAGLPSGLGDSILVEYESKEKIWKYSNQSNILNEHAIDDIYNAFYDLAKKNGYDFK